MTRFTVSPAEAIGGDVRVPGDKSISHRAVILASIASGTSRVSGFLQGEDSLKTMRAFMQMGVPIEREGDRLRIDGVGLHGLQAPPGDLDMGNSGTAMRLLLGLLAGQKFDSRLVGDASLSSRPMGRVIEPLVAMGAVIGSRDEGRAPLEITGSRRLRGIDYTLPVASAQVKSCLLLAGLYAKGETVVREPAPTRDHSERMLRGFGCELVAADGVIRIVGGQQLRACDVDVPADISSAAFFLVAASIRPGSDITLRHVGINPTRTGVIEILRLMGADIEIGGQRVVGGEPVADIRVRGAQLRGIDIPHRLVPLAIDEFPVLFVAAACARGITRLSGAEELRVKESDRIQVMADGLQTLGIDTEVLEDGIVIHAGQLGGGEIDSHGDHRIAMAFSVAGLAAARDVVIRDCANVATSFPGFVELARETGFRIAIDG